LAHTGEISFSISGGGPHLHKLAGRASTGPYNTVSCRARVELKKQVFGRAVGETTRISANGNPTLCTSVIVPGRGYHVQSLSQVVQIHTTHE
jgi:hypothetical protein